jgi:hypothetical protein
MSSSEREPNPYQSPAAPPAATVENWATAPVVESLRQTRPWVMFFSILGFIVAALMAVGGLLGGMVVLAQGSPAEGAVLMIYLLFGLLYFFPALYLLRYAQRIRDLIYSHNVADLEAALSAQKSFWRFTGILVALILVLYVVLLLGGLVILAFSTMR